MTNDDTFRVWIGCLACYNDGRLVGQWYDASEAGEVTTKALHARDGIKTNEQGYVKGQEIYGPHEELWVVDLENAPKGFYREMSPMEAQQIADALEDIERELPDEQEREAYFLWIDDHYGQPSVDTLADYVSEFQDAFQGVWSSFRDFADSWADEMLDAEAIRPNASIYGGHTYASEPELFARRYFDYEAHADDLEQSVSTYTLSGCYVAVFWNN